MIIQKILFPHKNICTEEKLYFRTKDCIISENIEEELDDQAERAEKEYFSNSFLNVVFGGSSGSTAAGNLPERLREIRSMCVSGKHSEAVLFMQKAQKLSLDTYFNSFSVFKWKKYTDLDDLSLTIDYTGAFRFTVKNAIRRQNDNHIVTLDTFEVNETGKSRAEFKIPLDRCDTGLIYLEAESLKDSPAVIFGAAFTSEIKNASKEGTSRSPVKIAIAMCTYKREMYVERNVKELSEFLIENKKSPLSGNLELYIADNGNGLDEKSISSKFIHVFPNRNLGGAGGFGRAMYEILKEKEKKKFTNIIMMDDDIKYDPNVFERLYSFLTLLKDKYKEAHIGGAMLELDNMWLQSESGEHWYPKGHKPAKFRYDLRELKWILKNEIEDSVDNFGWWFCCMPISVVQENNLPMPVFIKRDDIEYGVRNGRYFINLNGISVWHEAFDAKRVPFLDYYYYRNPLILNAAHCKGFDLMEMLDYLDTIRGKIDFDVNLYRYKEAHLKLKGIDDFLKGIDWLKSVDAEALNTAIMKRWTYQETYMEEIGNVIFVHGEWERSLNYKETPEETEARLSTDNGWAVPPTKGRVLAPLKNPHPGLVCGAKKVVYYDEISQKGYVTYRSHTQRDAVYKHFEETRKNLIDNYERVRKEYNRRFDELIDISFWEDYLFEDKGIKEIPVEWWENVSDISIGRDHAEKEALAQYRLEAEEQIKRIPEYPIKQNRVTLYLYQRRGFTCNLKYILKELIREAGDKLELIWISDHPETCGEVKKLGIPVVKAGTKEHWEYHFTARVNVTSDSQPPYFIKRDDQVAINAWHGGLSYKIIGYGCMSKSSETELEIYGLRNRQPDHWLSGCRRFTEDTAKGFRHDEKAFAPTGMARNDVFFSDQSGLIKDVRKKLGIPKNAKTMLYAPTFRRGGRSTSRSFNISDVKNALKDRWGGEWVVLYRGHYFIKDNPKLDAIDVSQYDDVQDLLLLADVVISDYSSCLWDYSFTGKPSFVYAEDLDEYLYNDRGFFVPPELWPYPIAKDSDSLCENILNFDEKDYKEKIKKHHKDMGSYEKGKSAEAACKIIKEACGI